METLPEAQWLIHMRNLLYSCLYDTFLRCILYLSFQLSLEEGCMINPPFPLRQWVQKVCMMCLKLWDFPGGSDDKESAFNVGHVGLIPGSGRSPGEGIGYHLLQYSCLENSMGRGTWQSMGSQRVRHKRINLACRHVQSYTANEIAKSTSEDNWFQRR